METFAPIKRASLIKEISNQIARHIMENRLPPGSKLPSERQLVGQFGVGRSTVREALRMLEQAGLITIKAGLQGGNYVAEADHTRASNALSVVLWIDGATMDEALSAREILESNLARLAAKNATDEDLSKMMTAIEETENDLDSAENYLASNLAFHIAVAEAARNKVLFAMMHSTIQLMDRAINKIAINRDLISSAVAGHRKIYEAISRRDGQAAEAALIEHVRRFKDRVNEVYSGEIGFQI